MGRWGYCGGAELCPPKRLCGMMRAMEAAAGRRRSHAAGLRAIALFEASKGMLVLLAALGVAEFFHGSLEDTAAHLLFRLHISPERRLGRVLLEAAAKLSDAGLVQLALIATAYSAARFIEAWGLWRGRAWAQWFAVLSGLVYLPWEFAALVAKPDWIRGGLMAGNVLLVVYIARLRLAERRGRGL